MRLVIREKDRIENVKLIGGKGVGILELCKMLIENRKG